METPREEVPEDNCNKSNHLLGQVVAVGMGIGVGYINREHGWLLLTTAATKQFLYSAIAAGLFIEAQRKIYDHFRARDESLKADALAVAVPAIGTIALTYILHSLKGTPETVASTIPTAILAPIGYSILQIRRRIKELENVLKDIMAEF